MKKIVSVFMALLMLFSVFSANSVAYSATKVYAEDKLESIQKTKGFIPGQDAAVIGNCYGFISAVCEKLYGVKYDGEGLYGNYQAKHNTGNYYTVSKYQTTSTTWTVSIAKKIRDFFINNAQPGDVVHYGAYTTSTGNSSTHTFMIQHIDKDKMQIYHSNYETRLYSRSSCHIDTIRWKDFISGSTQTIYNNDETIYSMNSLFYGKMKSTGLGITINRYTNYTSKFITVDTGAVVETAPAAPVPTPSKVTGLTVTETSPTVISIKWDKADNAEEYFISVTNDTRGTTFSKTVTTTSTTLGNLTENNSYTIKVKAINLQGKSGSYSSSVTAVAKAKTASVKNLKITAYTNETISVEWDKLKNATKYQLLLKNLDTGNSYPVKELTTNSRVVQGLTPGCAYSISVRAYVPSTGWSKYVGVSGATKPNKMVITSLTSPSKNQVRVAWSKPDCNYTGYQVFVSTDKSFSTEVSKKYLDNTKYVASIFKDLKKGKVYYAKVRVYRTVDGKRYYGACSTVKSVKCK